jgi:hypothetical protein
MNWPPRLHLGLKFKLGHCEIQIRPLRVKTGQHHFPRWRKTEFAKNRLYDFSGTPGTGMTEIIKYRGYDLHVGPQGSGIRVMFRPSSGGLFRKEIAYDPDKSRREQMIAQAKATVDSLLASHNQKPD